MKFRKGLSIKDRLRESDRVGASWRDPLGQALGKIESGKDWSKAPPGMKSSVGSPGEESPAHQ